MARPVHEALSAAFSRGPLGALLLVGVLVGGG